MTRGAAQRVAEAKYVAEDMGKDMVVIGHAGAGVRQAP